MDELPKDHPKEQDPPAVTEETKQPEEPVQNTVRWELECHDLVELVAKSEEFTRNIRQPTHDNWVRNILMSQPTEEDRTKMAHMIECQVRRCRTIVHHSLWPLIEEFLKIKRESGTTKEKKLYAEMTADDFIKRTMTKRPLYFFGSSDSTLLRDGTSPPCGDWSHVAKDDDEDEPRQISIENYMTYDEIQISALIGASCPCFFINEGGRTNHGKASRNARFPLEGVYVGLVGARFEKQQYMESQYILVRQKENTAEKFFGANPKNPDAMEAKLRKMWANFYGFSHLHTFQEIDELYKDPDPEKKKNAEEMFYFHHPHQWADPFYMNKIIYQKRMRITVESFLADADRHGKWEAERTDIPEDDKKSGVFCHVVGLGLGVWQVANKQGAWLLAVFADAICAGDYKHIKHIDFSWFQDSKCGDAEDGKFLKDHAGNDIKITFSKRNPADDLPDDDDDLLLVAMYAWDGNSFPGNEYWGGMLSASGDPAAACCSTIPELQNPEINKFLLEIEKLNSVWNPSMKTSVEEEFEKLREKPSPTPPTSPTTSEIEMKEDGEESSTAESTEDATTPTTASASASQSGTQ